MPDTEIAVAVVNYAFPVTTQTFHHRRQRAMLDAGTLEAIHFVKHSDGEIEPSSSAITDQAHVLAWPERLAGVRQLRRRDVRRALVEGLKCARNDNAEGGRLGFVWQAWCGMSIGQKIRESGATHVHAVFATAPATIGLFASLVSGLALSIEVHTPSSRTSNPDLLKFKLGQADLVVSISGYTSAWLDELDPSLEPTIVRCGLDVAEPPQLQDPTIHILAVGSLAPKKGHDVLIDAVAQLQGTRLTIVGEGPDRQALQARAAEAGIDATFEGALAPEQVAALRSRARIGVLASVRTADGDEDGIPVALMEFMLDGVPVVASDIAGIRELLADGEAGALVPPGSPSALAAALQRALTDDGWREQVVDAARARIETTFNNELETERLLDLLRQLPSRVPAAHPDHR